MTKDAFLFEMERLFPTRFRRHLRQELSPDVFDVAREGEIITLTGPVGTGKSTAAAAIAFQLIVKVFDKAPDFRGRPEFVTYKEVLNRIMAGYSNGTAQNVRSDFEKRFILVIDELFNVAPTDNSYEEVYQIINYRYAWQKITIITTNLDLNQIAEIDDRIASRLAEGLVRDLSTVRRKPKH